MRNEDWTTVEGFGDEWARFDNRPVSADERATLFAQVLRRVPVDRAADRGARGSMPAADRGAGRRWSPTASAGSTASTPAPTALDVARHTLASASNCTFHLASVSALPFENGTMDFGYSLGVLHHTPDPADGLRACVSALKPGAPFLLYLYYRFDNRPLWFRLDLGGVEPGARRRLDASRRGGDSPSATSSPRSSTGRSPARRDYSNDLVPRSTPSRCPTTAHAAST